MAAGYGRARLTAMAGATGSGAGAAVGDWAPWCRRHPQALGDGGFQQDSQCAADLVTLVGLPVAVGHLGSVPRPAAHALFAVHRHTVHNDGIAIMKAAERVAEAAAAPPCAVAGEPGHGMYSSYRGAALDNQPEVSHFANR
ncbi:hypothetical protein [Streptomyces halobius]|uniref:Uncharacterized protein n=1 Tax=Streptomyces halobius TaxID=2879846 RepID=A0ABY4M4N3_9ACTN|nr:hypothetical protein [Streptomyces halobius]UQA92357.1 hypothetical protein K9S39_11370 [Streptomyces halobius]